MAGPKRVSAGLYEVNGNIVRQQDLKGLLSGGRSSKPSSKPPRSAKPKGQGLLANAPQLKNADINTASEAIRGQLGVNDYVAGQNANLNRVNEYNPWGSSTFQRNPDGSWGRTTSLSPGQAEIDQRLTDADRVNLETSQNAGWQMRNNFSQPYSLDGMPQIPGQNDLLGERRRVEDALMNRFDERLNPQFERERKSLESRLMEQGIAYGSDAYKNQMADQYRNQQDSRRDYTVDAVQLGGSEFERNFNTGLANRNQSIGEYEKQRYAPLNEIQGINQTVRGVMTPNYSPTTQIDYGNVDVGGTYLGYAANDLARDSLARSGAGGGGGGGGGGNYVDDIIRFQMGPQGGGGGVPSGGGAGSAIGNFGAGFGQGFGIGATANTLYGGQKGKVAQMRRGSGQGFLAGL